MSATPITEQILQLRYEAGVAGDLEMAAVAVQALNGDQDAIDECAAVIHGAQQMGTDAEGVADD